MRLPSGRSRQRGQSIVEFGIIALTFVLLMFAVVDLGMLVNTWVRLSSTTRDVARLASVGYLGTELESLIKAQGLPGVSPNLGTRFSGYCCTNNNKLELTVKYYYSPGPGPCIPGQAGCNQITNSAQLFQGYWQGGSCVAPNPNCHPRPGDTLVVSIAAPGMEVITPLVRPFFASDTCRSTELHCYLRLGSTTIVRFEGGRTGI